MKYYINDKVFSGVEYVAEYIIESLAHHVLKDKYRDMLNEVYGKIDVCGYIKPAGFVLEQTDPEAFRIGLDSYKAPAKRDIIGALENMAIGDEMFWYGHIIVAASDDYVAEV